MSDLPRKYTKMERSKLNELAVAGDEYAQRALIIHQKFDRLADEMERLYKRVKEA